MGPRLGGRYELADVLGAGAMARVWRATDLVLGREVAVKVLDPALARDPEYVARFAREARNAAMLPTHPGIVTIFDSGAADGAAYLVMELVTGRTLAEVLARQGALDPAEACRIAAAVCQALSVAHQAGLVHRDVKPGNIMLTDAGGVKVVDFGIARAQSGEALTRAGAVLGSPSYMAPEQITGAAVDARTDLYALGVVLFQMLTGTPPFADADSFAVLHRHLGEIPPPPSALRPGLPYRLDQTVACLLAKDPAHRPATASQAERMIADAGGVRTDAVATVALTPQPPHGTRLLTALPADPYHAAPDSPTGARRPGVLAAGVVALLAVVAIVAWLLLRGPAPAPAASTSGTTSAAASGAALSTSSAGTSASPSTSTSPTASASTPAQALDALQQAIDDQTSAGALDEQAQSNLSDQLQNMQDLLSQHQDEQNQSSKDFSHQMNDQIKNMRQQLANLVQQGDATATASTAINGALDQLQLTLG